MQRNRRGSVTQNAFSQLFQRSSSIAGGTPVMPSAVTTAAINEQRRRLSLSTTTTLGITGTSPNTASGLARRSSTSTNSEFDENAIDEEDSPTSSRTVPTTPFSRRMSFGAAAAMRRPGGTSPGTVNGTHTAQFSVDPTARSAQRRSSTDAVRVPPQSVSTSATPWEVLSSTIIQTQAQRSNNTTDTSTATSSVPSASSHTRSRANSDLLSATRPDQGFNWSEQLRSRAESTVASGSRPSFAFGSGLTGSPPRPAAVAPGPHERARSVSEMPAPPAQAPKPRSPPRDTRPKPDHFQERILKGDFYMD